MVGRKDRRNRGGPKKGLVLGNEMMLTARRYQGRELKSRGAPMEIVPKDKVLPKALEMAELLVKKPLLQLQRLKAHLVGPIQRELISIFEKEQAMHDIVFAEHRESTNKEEQDSWVNRIPFSMIPKEIER